MPPSFVLDMDPSRPQKPTGTTNELAKERNRSAAERTINAWIGQCIGLMAVGVTFDQISLSLSRRYPTANWAIPPHRVHLIGLTFVAVGLILLAIALLQHRLQIKSIEHDGDVLQSVSTLNRLAVAAIILFGFSGLFATLVLL